MPKSKQPHALVRAKVDADHLLKGLRSERETVARNAALRLRQAPYFQDFTPEEIVRLDPPVKKQQAQHVVAIERGFDSWGDLKKACGRGQVENVSAAGPLDARDLLTLAAQGIRNIHPTDVIARLAHGVLEITVIETFDESEGLAVFLVADGLQAVDDARVVSVSADGTPDDSETIIVLDTRQQYIVRSDDVAAEDTDLGRLYRIDAGDVEDTLSVLAPTECVHCGGLVASGGQRSAATRCAECGHNRWTGESMPR